MDIQCGHATQHMSADKEMSFLSFFFFTSYQLLLCLQPVAYKFTATQENGRSTRFKIIYSSSQR